MFERFTEKARRVIFFARYEASQYGSATIETEHMLLGLLREDYALMHRVLGTAGAGAQIRTEIERIITRGKPIATSVEVPLSADSKKILNLAAEEAEKLGHRHVGTEHFLLGILGVGDSLAAKLLIARGAIAAIIREEIAKSGSVPATEKRSTSSALLTLDSFLAGLKGLGAGHLVGFFADKGQFVDSCGKHWAGREEIAKESETLFAPFAKKNATCLLEEVVNGSSETVVATVLWQFAASTADHSKSMFRMSIVMVTTEDDWQILLLQVTPVLPGPMPTR